MSLRVRAQSVYVIEYCPLCEILRGLLQTTLRIGCRHHVSSFANAPGVFVLFQASELLQVWSSGSITQTSLRCCRPHLHSLILIMLLLPLPRWFSPVYITEHKPKYDSIEKIIKLRFQWVLIHLNRSSYEGVMAVSLQLCLLSRNFRTCNHRWFGHIRL
jgi:hypothetical protein